MKFPERVYTTSEVELARSLIDKGYRHRLRIIGSEAFRSKVKEALKLIKKAGYYNFLRTYIKRILEIEGLSQLRESEASIWVNKYAVEDPYEAAGFIIQKAWQMKAYLEGLPYYGHVGEFEATKIRIKFFKDLKKRSKDLEVQKRCEKIIKFWEESVFL